MPRARVASLSEVILRVTGSLDLDTVLQEIVDGACSLTDARYGAVVLFDDSRQVQQFVTFGMNSEGCQQLGDIRDPLRLADLTRHTPPAGFTEDSPPIKTFLAVPIWHRGEQIGNVYLDEKEGYREFTEDDEETLVMFASHAGVAIGDMVVTAAKRLRERRPDAVDVWSVRVGYRTLRHFGGGSMRRTG